MSRTSGLSSLDSSPPPSDDDVVAIQTPPPRRSASSSSSSGSSSSRSSSSSSSGSSSGSSTSSSSGSSGSSHSSGASGGSPKSASDHHQPHHAPFFAEMSMRGGDITAGFGLESPANEPTPEAAALAADAGEKPKLDGGDDNEQLANSKRRGGPSKSFEFEGDGKKGTGLSANVAELETKLEELFPYYGDGSVITALDFVDLLADLGISIDEEEITTLVVDPDAIALPEAVEALHRLGSQNAQVDSALQRSNVSVVQVSPWEWVKMKLMCSTEPHTHYKVRWSDLQPSPRQQLIGSTFLALTLTAGLIVLSIALLWEDYLRDPEDRWSEAGIRATLGIANGIDDMTTSVANSSNQEKVRALTSFLDVGSRAVAEGSAMRLRLAAALARGVGNSVVIATSTRRRHVVAAAMRGVSRASAVKANFTTSDALRPFDRDTAGQALRTEIDAGSVVVRAQTAGGAQASPAGYSTTPCDALCTTQIDACFANLTAMSAASAVDMPDVLGQATASGGVLLCAYIPESHSAIDAQRAAVLVLSSETANATSLARRNSGLIVRAFIPNSTETGVTWLDTRENTAMVSSCQEDAACVTPNALEAAAVTTMTDNVGTSFDTSTTDPATAGYVSRLSYGVGFAATREVADIEQTMSNLAIRCTTHLNTAQIAVPGSLPAPELSLAGQPSSGSTTTELQLTPPLNTSECFGLCQRFPIATVVQEAALAFPRGSEGLATALQHDYGPRPVVAAAAIMYSIDIAVVAETQLRPLRESAAQMVAATFDHINGGQEKWAITLAGIRGMPRARTFDQSEACTAELTCYERAADGVIYRSDCTDCVGLINPPRWDSIDELIDSDSIEFLTARTSYEQARCSGRSLTTTSDAVQCTDSVKNDYHVHARPLVGIPKNADELFMPEENVAFPFHREVLASSALQSRSSLSIVLFWEQSEYAVGDLWRMAVGFSFLLLAVILTVQLLVARLVMHDIESEWAQYTTRIQEESQVFAEMVVDIFPIEIAERIMKGARRVSDQQQLSFVFVNICQFEALYRSKMEPTILCLFSSYYYLLMSNIALHYKLYRVRTFGDTVFIVGGLSDEKDSNAFNNMCHRTLQAAAVILELFAYQWQHTPGHVACLRDITATERTVVMPSVKIGCHCGPATVLVEPSSVGPPVFDVIGANAGTAVAIAGAAHTNTINVSEAVLDAARRSSTKMDMFVFDDATRRVSSKSGVLKTQLMRGANVPVPPSVVFALGIRRATVRVQCGMEDKVQHHQHQHGGGTPDAGSSNVSSRGK